MKNTVYTLLAAAAILGSCVPMDIAPKSQGSSASWYTTETELKMAVNEFYILGYWNYLESSERWTDIPQVFPHQIPFGNAVSGGHVPLLIYLGRAVFLQVDQDLEAAYTLTLRPGRSQDGKQDKKTG